MKSKMQWREQGAVCIITHCLTLKETGAVQLSEPDVDGGGDTMQKSTTHCGFDAAATEKASDGAYLMMSIYKGSHQNGWM